MKLPRRLYGTPIFRFSLAFAVSSGLIGGILLDRFVIGPFLPNAMVNNFRLMAEA